MRWPRLSIAGLMALVVAAALDIAVVRASVVPLDYECEVIGLAGLVPMANALALVGLAACLALKRRGEFGLTAVGFLIGGVASGTLFSLAILLIPHPIQDSVFAIVTRLIRATVPPDADLSGVFGAVVEMTAAGLALAPILFAPALLGAWLGRGRMVRVSIVGRSGWKAEGEGGHPIPPDPPSAALPDATMAADHQWPQPR